MNENFSIPIDISGMVGDDFGKRVNGHYYWFIGLPSGLKGILKGKVGVAYNIEEQIHILDNMI